MVMVEATFSEAPAVGELLSAVRAAGSGRALLVPLAKLQQMLRQLNASGEGLAELLPESTCVELCDVCTEVLADTSSSSALLGKASSLFCEALGWWAPAQPGAMACAIANLLVGGGANATAAAAPSTPDGWEARGWGLVTVATTSLQQPSQLALCFAAMAMTPYPSDLLWGPFRAACTGHVTPAPPVTSRRLRAECLNQWLVAALRFARSASRSNIGSQPKRHEARPALELAADVLEHWLLECESPSLWGKASAANTTFGNDHASTKLTTIDTADGGTRDRVESHIPNTLQTKILRQVVSFALAVDTLLPANDGDNALVPTDTALRLLLHRLATRPLQFKSTLDSWIAAVHVLQQHCWQQSTRGSAASQHLPPAHLRLLNVRAWLDRVSPGMDEQLLEWVTDPAVPRTRSSVRVQYRSTATSSICFVLFVVCDDIIH